MRRSWCDDASSAGVGDARIWAPLKSATIKTPASCAANATAAGTSR
jgi:hypothetical protein